jgi:hypothetical protein
LEEFFDFFAVFLEFVFHFLVLVFNGGIHFQL